MIQSARFRGCWATFNTDGLLLAIGSGNGYDTTSVWDTETGEELAESYDYSWQLTFSPDSRILAGSSRYGGSGQFWNFTDTDESRVIEFASHYALAADFSVDGTFYAAIVRPITLPLRLTMWFWDVQTGDELHRITILDNVPSEPSKTVMSFSPDGTRIMTYDELSGVRIWGVFSN
jgi:WD40 repeat protein